MIHTLHIANKHNFKIKLTLFGAIDDELGSVGFGVATREIPLKSLELCHGARFFDISFILDDENWSPC